MDGGRLSDFSIERILSPQLGPSRAEPQHPPGRFGADTGAPRNHPPVLLHYLPLSFQEPCFQYFHHPDFSCVYSTHGVHPHLSGQREAPVAPQAGYHGYHPPGVPAQAQLRQKARARTVFTDAQLGQLEALFDLTEYPPAEARAELATSSGLSEETVRVWFKNRRARRKQQRCSSKVKPTTNKPPSPPCPTPAESKGMASVL